MTKNEYLNLRQNDGKLQIMHIYHNENIGLANLTFNEFRKALHTYLKKKSVETNTSEQVLFDNMFNHTIDYFDTKYDVVYIQITKQRIITKTITIVK